MPVQLYREKYPPDFRALRLASRTELAPDFVRVRLQSETPDALVGFRAPGAGDHGRVFVGRAADEWRLSVDSRGEPLGDARLETVVDHSVDEGWIDLDILVHRGLDGAPAGLIGPWAAEAPLGSPAVMADPKGSVLMRGAPEAWVLAGDDSAIPAIRRYLRALAEVAPDAPGVVLLETRHQPEALGLEIPAGVKTRILSPGSTPSAELIAALQTLDRPLPAPAEAGESTDILLFACAEQSIVTAAREVLGRWRVDPENAVAKGYWKRG